MPSSSTLVILDHKYIHIYIYYIYIFDPFLFHVVYNVIYGLALVSPPPDSYPVVPTFFN